MKALLSTIMICTLTVLPASCDRQQLTDEVPGQTDSPVTEDPPAADRAIYVFIGGSHLMVPSGKWLEFGGGVISGLFESQHRRWSAGGDHAMTTDSTTTVDDGTLFLGEAWSDPIEAAIRDRIRVSSKS